MDEVEISSPETRALVFDAYQLLDARGVDLLLKLGQFDVWRGDLAAMRDDPGREEAFVGSPPVSARFRAVHALSKALAYLRPQCSEVIHLHFVQGLNAVGIAAKMETTDRYAEKLVDNCTRRLFEIAQSIEKKRDSAPDDPSIGSTDSSDDLDIMGPDANQTDVRPRSNRHR